MRPTAVAIQLRVSMTAITGLLRSVLLICNLLGRIQWSDSVSVGSSSAK